MKNIYKVTLFTLIACTTGSSLRADEASAEITTESETSAEPRVVVFLPERIDTEWFWYYYTDTSQHIVQSAIEKTLRRKGFNVVDLTVASGLQGDGNISALSSKAEATKMAAALGATHLILGSATATMSSRDVAYGVTVYRSQAEITAKLVRIGDGKILAVEEASEIAGGQAQKAAGQLALKDASKKIARDIASATEEKLGTPST